MNSGAMHARERGTINAVSKRVSPIPDAVVIPFARERKRNNKKPESFRTIEEKSFPEKRSVFDILTANSVTRLQVEKQSENIACLGQAFAQSGTARVEGASPLIDAKKGATLHVNEYRRTLDAAPSHGQAKVGALEDDLARVSVLLAPARHAAGNLQHYKNHFAQGASTQTNHDRNSSWNMENVVIRRMLKDNAH